MQILNICISKRGDTPPLTPKTWDVKNIHGCRGYGDSHGYGYGMGMGTVMNPHGFCG